MKPLLLLAAALAAVALPTHAAAAPGLLLGVDDDSLKWYSHTGSLLSIYRDLGVGAVRVTLEWTPGESYPVGNERIELQRAANAGRSVRVVLAVTGPADSPPLDDAGRASYCGFVANVLARYAWIRDVAIWTEPNSSQFWQPRHGAAAAYEALLAQCWDTLHALEPGVNVIATSSSHAKPGRWYANVGKAYRASGRMLPIFDTVGHNPYPQDSAEAPDAKHANGPIDEGDVTRLLDALHHAFDGTAQPVAPIWYMEDGFQSSPDAERGLYTGSETDAHPVSEAEQAAQLAAAVRLAYCEPGVGAFFNFELRDDASLSGWQSGLLRPDWSAKPAFVSYLEAIAAARAGTIACKGSNG